MRAAVGGWGGRGFLAPVLTVLLFQRLGQICREMEGLAARFQSARFQSGRLWRMAPRAGRAERVRAAVEAGVCAGLARVWPYRFGWLVRAAAHHAAVYNGQLRVILERPEMVELLVAAPQAARILRPLCRMLAVEEALLRPGVPGEVAAEPVVPAVAKRVRGPRPAIDWGRIPLPRGVASWIRRERALERAKARVRGEG